jgi:hypothetical protein
MARGSLPACLTYVSGRELLIRPQYLFKEGHRRQDTSPAAAPPADAPRRGRLVGPMLMALSGHENLRTLGIYVNPGDDAVAALLASHDPGRRRR